MKMLQTALMRVFYREIQISGVEALPDRPDGVLLVATHPNGDVDQMLIEHALQKSNQTFDFVFVDTLEERHLEGIRQIVPVVLFYSQRQRFRSRALVWFGRPFEATTVEAVRDGVNDHGQGLDTSKGSEVIGWAAELMLGETYGPTPVGELPATAAEIGTLRRQLTEGYAQLQSADAEMLEALEERVSAFHGRLTDMGLEPAELHMEYRRSTDLNFAVRELELVFIGSWLALWGALNHGIPYFLIRPLARRAAEDPTDIAAQKIRLTARIFPVFYLGQTALVAAFAPGWVAALYLATLPAFGYYALAYVERVRASGRRLRSFLTLALRRTKHDALLVEADAITRTIRSLADQLGVQ